jgi:hypothetical protein
MYTAYSHPPSPPLKSCGSTLVMCTGLYHSKKCNHEVSQLSFFLKINSVIFRHNKPENLSLVFYEVEANVLLV